MIEAASAVGRHSYGAEAVAAQKSINNNAGFSSRVNKNSQAQSVTYLRTQTLCRTLGGNNVPLITVTALPVLTGHLQTDLGTALAISEVFFQSISISTGPYIVQSLARSGNRPYVFLTARVHPGESNSSWVMKGEHVPS